MRCRRKTLRSRGCLSMVSICFSLHDDGIGKLPALREWNRHSKPTRDVLRPRSILFDSQSRAAPHIPRVTSKHIPRPDDVCSTAIPVRTKYKGCGLYRSCVRKLPRMNLISSPQYTGFAADKCASRLISAIHSPDVSAIKGMRGIRGVEG
jgi:hypothetical protein